MTPKNGTAGSAIEPLAPAAVKEAVTAEAGEVSTAQGGSHQNQTTELGAVKAKPFKPLSEEEARQQETSWIEIELVGEDDKPIAGERYRVTLPDGSVDEGALDHNGWKRIEGFAPGSCQVTFPELDQDAWEFIESTGPRSA